MKKILGPEFFDRPTLVVARELLGKYLVRRVEDKTTAYMITETEGYDGPRDLAAHSAKGRTARTEVLFGPPGVWYVYFIYGIHEMLNVVTKKDGAAVLIRGVMANPAFSNSREYKNVAEKSAWLDGPGKVTKALGITRELNKKPATKKSGLWVEDRGIIVKPSQIKKSARVGVAYAGPVWGIKLWRFIFENKKSADRSRRP